MAKLPGSVFFAGDKPAGGGATSRGGDRVAGKCGAGMGGMVGGSSFTTGEESSPAGGSSLPLSGRGGFTAWSTTAGTGAGTSVRPRAGLSGAGGTTITRPVGSSSVRTTGGVFGCDGDAVAGRNFITMMAAAETAAAASVG